MLKSDGTLVLSSNSVLKNDKKIKLAACVDAGVPTLKTIDQHSWCREATTQAKNFGTNNFDVPECPHHGMSSGKSNEILY